MVLLWKKDMEKKIIREWSLILSLIIWLFEDNGKGSATGPDVISVFGGATVKINNKTAAKCERQI